MNPTGSSTLHHLVLAFTRVCSVLGAGLSTESRDVSPRGSGNVGAEEGPERGGATVAGCDRIASLYITVLHC